MTIGFSKSAAAFAARAAMVYAILLLVVGPPAAAGPENCSCQSGTIVINQNGNVWIIQASDLGILNCAGFDIAQFETVQFIQPGQAARVLTRVFDADGTQINGALLSNGIVYIVNQAGVMFGANAVLDVGGLYAAAGHIEDGDFLGGTDRFTSLAGPVVNHGTVHAQQAVHLIGQYVENHGVITVDGTSPVLTMLAGSEVVITPMGGGGKVSVVLNGHNLGAVQGVSGGVVVPHTGGPAGVLNTGTIRVGAASGGGAAGGPGQVILGAGDVYSLAINNAGTIDAGGADVQLVGLGASSTVWQQGTIDAGGLAMSGGVLLMDGGVSAGDVDFFDPVVLGRDLTVTASQSVHFHSSVESESGERNDLTIAKKSAGDNLTTTFDGAVGGGAYGHAAQLGTLHVDGTAVVNGGSITTANHQIYDGAVRLQSNTTLLATNVTFNATLDSFSGFGTDASLTVRTFNDGLVTFNDAVGQNVALRDLLIDGSALLNGGSVATSGSQVYEGDVTLGPDADTTTLSAESISFESLVDGSSAGGQGLVIEVADEVEFEAKVGSQVALRDLVIHGDCELDADEGQMLVHTTGTQMYDGAVAIESDTVLAGSHITFGSTVDGAFDLEIQAGATFLGDVGSEEALDTLLVEGDTTIGGEGIDEVSVRTIGAQRYQGQVTLGSDARLAGDLVRFDSLVNATSTGGQGLTIEEGDVVFADKVGSEVALGHLDVVGGTTALNGDLVFTTGAQHYGGDVTLGAGMVLAGSTVTFDQAVDGSGGGEFLIIQGDAVFGGAVGGDEALSLLQVSGDAAINGRSVTTALGQSYGGAVTLGGDATLSGTAIAFGSTVTGDSADLDVDGDVSFGGDVTLASLDVLGSTTIAAAAGDAVTEITTTGLQTYGGEVVLASDAALTGAQVAFHSTLDSQGEGEHGLVVNGAAQFDEAVGASSALAHLEVSGPALLNGGSVTTVGQQVYRGAVALGGDTVLDGGSVTFDSTLVGTPWDLQVLGDAGFGGDVSLASLSVSGATTISGASAADQNATTILTTGMQVYAGAVTLDDDAVFDGSSVTFASGVASAGDAQSLGVHGVAHLGGDVTAGGVAFHDGVQLEDDVTVDGRSGDVAFGSTIDGPFDLTVRTAGDASFAGDIGGAGALESFVTQVQGESQFDAGLIRAGLVSLNDGVTSSIDPASGVASIGAAGNMLIQADEFVMGANQSFVVVGTLRFQGLDGGSMASATLSTINVLEDLIVNAEEIFVRGDGTVVFVAGGTFDFPSAPQVLGSAQVRFASPTAEGDLIGTLLAFVNQAIGPVSAADLVRQLGADRQFLIVQRTGPTRTNVATAVAADLPRESTTDEVRPDEPLPAAAQSSLAETIGIRPRALSVQEIVALGAGRAIYDEQPKTLVDPALHEGRVVVNRLEPQLTRDLVNSYVRLCPAGTSPEAVRGALDAAWMEFTALSGGVPDAGGLAAHLLGSGRTEPLGYLELLNAISTRLANLGPTDAELDAPRRALLERFQPHSMTTDQFLAAIAGATGSHAAPAAAAATVEETPAPQEQPAPEPEPAGADILDGE